MLPLEILPNAETKSMSNLICLRFTFPNHKFGFLL